MQTLSGDIGRDVQAAVSQELHLLGKSIALYDWLLDHDRPTYMIEVKGNSMRDAHIVEGDFVVVERTETFAPGDIVVARIDGAWTIKFLREGDAGKRYLQAASDGDVSIYPTHELLIVAVVTTVIRRYRGT